MTSKTAATPHLAATIILLRDSVRGPEAFMVARRAEVASFAGALVFPGGKVDQQDSRERILACSYSDKTWDETQLLLRIAAIREAFEESGVLFARDRNTGELLSAQAMAALAEYRQPLDNRELSFAELLEQQQLELATDLLVHFSNWITPAAVPRRFDTHFFVAPVAADVQLLHCGRETDDSLWATAEDLLAGATAGRWHMVFPTLSNLSRIGLSASVAEILASAAAMPVEPIMPTMKKQPGGVQVSIAEEAGFPLREYLMAPP